MSPDLPAGTSCYVDANVLYYHFVDTPPFSAPCTAVVERTAAGDLPAACSHNVIAEVLHKVMLAEVVARYGESRAGLVGRLNRDPGMLRGLTRHIDTARELAALPLRLLPVTQADLLDAAVIASDVGLLMNDATIVAQMRRHGVTRLLTNDDDFDRVPGLSVWKPR